MGWFGHGLYDGDETFTRQLDFASRALRKNWDAVYDVYGDAKVLVLTPEHQAIAAQNIDRSYKRLAKKPAREGDYWRMESWAMDAHLLADLLINNRLPMKRKFKDDALAAIKWLKDVHAQDFNSPGARRKHLTKLEVKIKKYRKFS